ncbi:delta(1)-pyrroline-2-carboxylate reductase family protein [Actinoallomurus bryophytorum]|uniref:Ornithine cyclodeaminase n=1 Tax=Actinoallomurus bryophytorum TaxID=1490222 RepID=A0A543CWT1_9ACTN|nr:ornithine cyclodeaminase family protein [Actinoallomurus bryophytorum]TQM01566.1 ornithine cyclodeaminase [Actinoallomurus bryophytorum]
MINVEALPTEAEAADLLERALRSGLDPESGPARSVADVPAGQILLMPAAVHGYAGVKIATVAPGNRDLPRIQGVYLLLDGRTLAPIALLDGVALTAIRTPAVSALAVRHLAAADASHLVVFGTGPQAWGHVRALCAVRPVERVTVVGRGGTGEFVARCRASGLDASAGTPDAVAGADIVACCTTAREPLFPGDLVPAHAVVVAVGSHEPGAREVDGVLVARSEVFVESRAAALREAGDLIIPGVTRPPANLAELVTGTPRTGSGRPRLFKSVGMAWEDLVVAVAAYERMKG